MAQPDRRGRRIAPCAPDSVSERASTARRAEERGPHEIAQRFRGVVLWGAGAQRAARIAGPHENVQRFRGVHVRGAKSVIQ